MKKGTKRLCAGIAIAIFGLSITAFGIIQVKSNYPAYKEQKQIEKAKKAEEKAKRAEELAQKEKEKVKNFSVTILSEADSSYNYYIQHEMYYNPETYNVPAYSGFVGEINGEKYLIAIETDLRLNGIIEENIGKEVNLREEKKGINDTPYHYIALGQKEYKVFVLKKPLLKSNY